MARQGDVLENPRRLERALLIETGRETEGRRLVLGLTAGANGMATPVHFHPRQSETFHVKSGTLSYRKGSSERLTANAGETVVIEPGVLHSWWNDGPSTVELEGTVEPAGRLQYFLETVYGLIRDGRVAERGVSNLLQMAVIAHEFREDIVLAELPRAARVLLPLLSRLGRLRGYRASYPRYSDPGTSAS
jgi:quercetin dioxygenase-like cupin family protein